MHFMQLFCLLILLLSAFLTLLLDRNFNITILRLKNHNLSSIQTYDKW